SAPTALNAKVAAWARVVFMDRTSSFCCSGTTCAGSFHSMQRACQLPESTGKARNLTLKSPRKPIPLAIQREILPIVGNGARNAVHRAVGGLSGRGRSREPSGAARPPGAGDRRARHRQGTDRRTPAPPVGALGQALCD